MCLLHLPLSPTPGLIALHGPQTLSDVQAARDADAAHFEDALLKCKFECLEAAGRAREDSVAPLKAEAASVRVRRGVVDAVRPQQTPNPPAPAPRRWRRWQARLVKPVTDAHATTDGPSSAWPAPLQAALVALREQHGSDLDAQQDAAARQLAVQAKASDRLARELETAVTALQGQVAQAMERADVAEATLRGWVQAAQQLPVCGREDPGRTWSQRGGQGGPEQPAGP